MKFNSSSSYSPSLNWFESLILHDFNAQSRRLWRRMSAAPSGIPCSFLLSSGYYSDRCLRYDFALKDYRKKMWTYIYPSIIFKIIKKKKVPSNCDGICTALTSKRLAWSRFFFSCCFSIILLSHDLFFFVFQYHKKIIQWNPRGLEIPCWQPRSGWRTRKRLISQWNMNRVVNVKYELYWGYWRQYFDIFDRLGCLFWVAFNVTFSSFSEKEPSAPIRYDAPHSIKTLYLHEYLKFNNCSKIIHEKKI